MSEDGRPDALEDLLGYRFERSELLELALRHGSARQPGEESYERLEFLGDSVLGHAVARLLYERFPDLDQGGLTRVKAHLICATSLAAKAREIGLARFITVGPSEERVGGRQRTALLEDVLEAVIGAVELDGGWEAADALVGRLFVDELDDIDETELLLADSKSALQEVAQARGLPLPEYLQASQSGPDHALRWAFDVVWDGDVIARGEGRSKRAAQQEAARRALEILGIVG